MDELAKRRFSGILVSAERLGFTHVGVRKESGTIYGYGRIGTKFSFLADDAYEYITIDEYRTKYLQQ